MAKGVSELVSMVFFIAIIVAAIAMALNIALPQLQTMEDTAAIENNIDFLNTLDTAIQDVAAGGRYSQRELNLHFQRGEYGFDPENGELYYEIETDSPMISTHSTRPMGGVQLRANTDVTVTNTTIDGTDCHLLETERIAACIRQINATNAGDTNTGQMLVRLHHRATGTDLNGSLYIQINGTEMTRDGVEKTFVPETGSALSRGQVHAQVNTTNNGVYNITYELLSGADFLTVRADADTVTAGLRFVIDSQASDIVYIDGQQPGSAGVFDTDDIDFGYGIGQGNTLFSGVVAGSGFTRVGYDDAIGGGKYEINVSNSGDSIFLVPFTDGGVGDVEDRESVIRDGVIGRFFSYPAPNFGQTLSQEKTVRAILSYDHIALQGPRRTLASGTHQLLITNNGVADGKTNVSVSVK